MGYNITEIDGVIVQPTHRFPVEVFPEAHNLNDTLIHLGKLDVTQLPEDVMLDSEHQSDPHTMTIDGRDVSSDGSKLDTIEVGAQVNNLTNGQAQSLTSGLHSGWHHHDDFYFRKTEISTSGGSSVHWGNLTNIPSTFPATPHTHDDRYYTESEIDGIISNYYTKTELDNGQLDNRYYTESEITTLLSTKSDVGHIHDDRYYTESEIDVKLSAAAYGIAGAVDTFNDLPVSSDPGDIYIVRAATDYQHEGFWRWNGTIWEFLAKNEGAYLHDDLSGLNDGDYIHLDTNQYAILTDNQNASSLHIHDDRYYTETEINTIISNYSLNTHNHDDWYYRESEIDTLLSGKSNIGHIHDDRYYTETEINTLLSGKSNIGHIHDDRYYTEIELQTDGGSFVHWGNLTNVPTEFNPVDHNHDDRYYTEIELQTSGSAQIHWDNLTDVPNFQSNHNHDDRYYTETEIDTIISNYYTKNELNNGQLDNRYFTETEITTNYYNKTQTDTLLLGKSNVGHIHDDRYYTESEITANYYSKTQLNNGQLDDRYFTETEITTNFYSKNQLDTGQLDNRYYTETEINTLLDSKSNIGHTHVESEITDLDKYTQLEIDNLLSNKSDVGHIHDDRYYTEGEVDSMIAAASFGITGSVDTYDDLPTPTDDGVIYIVKTTTTQGDEGFYQWNGAWSYLAPNTGTTTHNSLSDLNTGNYIHLTPTQFDGLTGGNNTSLHLHDDRYYTELEVDTLISNYYTKNELNNGQLDNRYYTESEITTLLSGKSDINHIHDDRYYTENEVDTLITDAINAIPQVTHESLPDLGNDDHPQYTAHAQNEIITGNWDFTNGKLVVPNAAALPTGSYVGEVFWVTATSEMYGWTGTEWKPVSSAGTSVYANNTLSSNSVMVGDDGQRGIKESPVTISSSGSVDGVDYLHISRTGDTWMRLDHPSGSDLGTILVYKYVGASTTMILSDLDDGPIFRLQQTGNGSESSPQYRSEISMSNRNSNLIFNTGGTNRFEVESNGTLRSLNTSYESLVTSDDDIPNKKYVDQNIISDHGGLSGLGDDDHTQYLNEVRHDSLPSDNPHNVTITQAIAEDSGTDITTAELELLSDGSDITLHTHDSRYYTESEITTFLSGKSDINHIHDDRYYTETESDNKYSVIGHSHNDLYYTEGEVDTLLSNKTDVGHTHDDRYFTETEITTNYYNKTQTDSLIQAASFGITGSVDTFADLPTPVDDGVIYIVKQTVGSDEEGFYQWSSGSWTFLANNTGTTNHNSLPDINTGDYLHLTLIEYNDLTDGGNTLLHTHDSRYFTETEITTLLSGKSDVGHIHDDRYHTKSYINSNFYTVSQLNNGQLDNRYYRESEIDALLAGKSDVGHNHDDRYYTESETDSLLSGKSNTGHNHDDLYYRETEVDTFLNGKSDAGHVHDDRYFTENELSSITDSSSGADIIGATPISGGTANTVQGILEELKNDLNSSASSLDDAYNNGREITVDNQAVKLNSTSSTDAPLELTNRSSTPSTNLNSGQVAVIDNELFIYDGGRSKWLSPSKILNFALNNNSNGKLLSLPGRMRDWNSGARMVKDGTITSATIKTSNTVTKDFSILVNQSTIGTLTTDANGDYLNKTLNIDFSEGDIIQIYVESGGSPAFDPSVILEICWRK